MSNYKLALGKFLSGEIEVSPLDRALVEGYRELALEDWQLAFIPGLLDARQ